MLKFFLVLFLCSLPLKASNELTEVEGRKAVFENLALQHGVQVRDGRYVSDWTFSKGMPYSPQLSEQLENRWGEVGMMGFAKPHTFGICLTNWTGQELGELQFNFDEGYNVEYIVPVRNNTTIHILGNRAVSFLKRIKSLSHVSFVSELYQPRRMAMAAVGDLRLELFKLLHLVLYQHNGKFHLQPLGYRGHMKRSDYEGSMQVRLDY